MAKFNVLGKVTVHTNLKPAAHQQFKLESSYADLFLINKVPLVWWGLQYQSKSKTVNCKAVPQEIAGTVLKITICYLMV